jgi:hypothetical protein
MFFIRSLTLLVLCSLLAGALLFALGFALSPAERRGGYAVVVAPESVSDRLIQERLAPLASGFGGPPVSESAQWALLDEFDSIARIPLDEYAGRVSDSDPRNDGYAEKLRSLFARGGKRYVFIPLRSGVSAAPAFEKRIAAALAGIPFSLEYAGMGKPAGLYFGIFAAAALAFFGLRYALKRPAAPALWLLPCLPALAPLAFYGAAGFALASALLGISALLREPLLECCMLFRSPVIGGGNRRGFVRDAIIRDVYEPFRPHWLLFLLFAAAYAGMAFFAHIPPVFALPVFPLFILILAFSIWVFSRSGDSRAHLRFSPVLIMRRRSPDPVFSVSMLPFILAVLLAAALTPFLSRSTGLAALSGFSNIVTEADYRRHALFQSSFSRTPLGRNTDERAVAGAYPSYVLDRDGLIRPASAGESAAGSHIPGEDAADIPPFPLELARFLTAANNAEGGAALAGGAGGSRSILQLMIHEAFPALFLLVFFIPSIMFRGKNPALAKSRGAKGLRWGDKKLKKILVYSGERKKHFARRDA